MNQQFEILDTKQLLEFIKPISERIYWSVIAKDPRFPKPLMGGNGRKALHSRQAVEDYLKILARDGFIQPDSKGSPENRVGTGQMNNIQKTDCRVESEI